VTLYIFVYVVPKGDSVLMMRLPTIPLACGSLHGGLRDAVAPQLTKQPLLCMQSGNSIVHNENSVCRPMADSRRL